MNKLVFIFAEGFKNVWRHKSSAVSSIFSIYLTLIVSGSLLIISQNTNKLIEYLRDKYKIEVFFKDDVTEQRVTELVTEFKKKNIVQSITVISKKDAERIFKSQFGDDILGLLGYNPLPISCVINLKKDWPSRLDLQPIISDLKKYREVDEVRHQGKLISRIESYYDRFLQIMIIAISITLIIAIFIISNTVRLTIFSKKELIKSLQLIGATKWFIKGPFIIEGIVHGLIAAILAVYSLVGIIRFSKYLIYDLTKFGIIFDQVFIFQVLLSISILVGFIGANRAISRFLK
ncbi:MAG: permease-like cell division protein FtsX [Candidatus Neomarinimicrobiota bacterium]|jgi:cell division transport system permease protein|nr:permease-like cell division protein FtsX [Candidatus Neomarinimicrobiota bacterium]MEC7901916.1 permease-like cell division protein FtsX [Candidatus Neomarinimicrobiota bacterium]MED5248251.1 permease-like cell division protein FtsX [Candidatus Neomarinimicrobiota bacterium]|tara:strand:+ start:536 stop:1405 length:870 start_codon:yes stop_codon:yes gene_type:complete